MRSVSYRLEDLDGKKKIIIPIGFVGENEFTQVNIDCHCVLKDHPNAVVTSVITPPKGDEYPGALTRNGDIITWLVSASDVIYDGYGEIQLTFTDGVKIGKTWGVRTKVESSAAGSGNVPTPIQTWIEQANRKLADVETAAAEIDNMTVAASGSAYGTNPTAEISEVDNHKHIAFTIPAGAPGASGHTPEKGTDYWTAQDKQEMVGDVVSEMIDDTTPAVNKVFSSSKVDEELTDVKNTIQGLDEELNGEKVYSINLFNSADPDILDNKYIDGSTGQEESYNGMMETGFIACVPTDTFTFYNSDGYLSGYKHIAYYNAQKQFVDGSTGRQLPTITIPSGNIAYFRIALNKSSNSDLMIVKNDIEIHDYVPYGYTMSGGMTDSVYPWKGKNVVLFGDSIMYNDGHNGLHGYPYYLERLGFETITNKGENGACIAYHSERSSYKDICTAVDEVTFTNYDLVVIEGGINDYLATSASPIGTLVNSVTASDFDKTKFIGALQYIITKIIDAKATIKIVLFTPLKKVQWYNANSQGKTLIDYVSAMKQVAEYYSIPVLDYFAMSGLNRKNLSTFTSDGLHPNNDGYKFICENKLPAFINSMLTGAGASEKIDKPTSPSSGDFLVFNGTEWVAQSLSTWQGGNY